MDLINTILDLAGVLLWFSWRSFRFDPLSKTSPATLVGTLRRAEPRRLKGWQLPAGLAALLLLRAVLYREIGPDAGWTPKLNLFFVVLAFRGDLLLTAMLFSLLSFARILIVCHFWLLALVVINRRTIEPGPVLKMLRLQLGPVARWPSLLQVFLPLLLVAGLWIALHPLLLQLGVTHRVKTVACLAEQGLLVGTALYLTLQYLLPVILFFHLVASYVYLGGSPLWEFVGTTAGNLLAPLRCLPLRVARVDATPVAGVILILLLLHWLPGYVLTQLAERKLSTWPH